MTTAPASDSISERFNAPDSDICLRSVDGVRFHVHRKNLELHSETFATAEAISVPVARQEMEVVQLSETAEVLGLLLQFMYRQPQPDLTHLSFTEVADLVKAVEKYEVFSAMFRCETAMKAAFDGIVEAPQALVVLAYGTKHNDEELMNRAADYTLGTPPQKVYAALAPDAFLAWMLYHNQWRDVLQFAHAAYWTARHRTAYNSQPCMQHTHTRDNLLRATFVALKNIDRLRSLHNCPLGDCNDLFSVWKEKVEERVQAIPKFSTFLFKSG